MIQTLETQLAHERIAKGEALSRTDDDQRHEVERQLEEERLDRQQAEQEREGSCQPSGGRGTAAGGHGRSGRSEGSHARNRHAR
jgi:hypothetical protein